MQENNLKQAKAGRISKYQRRRLLDLMKEHRHVGKGQFTTKDAKKQHNAVWEAVSKELNSLGGSYKQSHQWKKCWIDWKASVKQLYGRHRAFSNRTGNLPASEGPKPMSSLDKEVLDFFSKDVVDGDGHTPEGGFEAVAVSSEYEVDENFVCLVEDLPMDVLEDDWAPEVNASFTAAKAAKNREPSSQSCVEEVKKVCARNQGQIMDALNRVIELIQTQNDTLAQVLHHLQNKS